MRRTLGIAFATTLVVAVACDDFTDADPPSSDAGAGETSSTVDASADDGAAPDVDAGIDASPVRFCSTVDAAIPFCWSFDDESTSALFGTVFSGKGDPVTLTQMASSPPNAMRAERDGSTSGATMITMQAPTAAKTKLACTISVFIEEISDQTELLTFGLGTHVASFYVAPLDANAVQSGLLVEHTNPKVFLGQNIPKRKWVPITLAAQTSGTGFLLATTTSYGDGGFTSATFPDAGENIFMQRPSIDVGFFVLYGGAGAVRVDDILCDWN